MLYRCPPLALAVLAVLAFVPLSRASAEVNFRLETQFMNPLLPGFYEPSTKRFNGLTVSVPVLPGMELQGGIARNHPYIDLPYNDHSNNHSTTVLLKAGAEVEALRIGWARFFVGSGIDYLRSSWEADDYAYEDPDLPRNYWSGAFSRWAVHVEPGLQLFRENQGVDWTLALSFPFYLAAGPDVKRENEAADGRFKEDYLNDTGMGVTVSIGLGFNR